MRVVLLVLVASCASQDAMLAVDVVTTPTGVYWYISPGASCTCQNVATFPASGTCSHDSDTPGCTCYPGACLHRVDLMQSDAVIGGVQLTNFPEPGTSDGFAGDFTLAGLSLRFVGCSEDAVAPLSNAFPEKVTNTVSTDKTQVSWPVVANDGFLVQAVGEFTGELCRTEPDAAAQTIDLGYYTSVSVSALRGPMTTTSGELAFHVWSTN